MCLYVCLFCINVDLCINVAVVAAPDGVSNSFHVNVVNLRTFND